MVEVFVEHLQADGRRYVQEVFTDDFGVYFENRYLARDGLDYLAISQSKEVEILAQCASAEVQSDLLSNKPPTARFQSVEEELSKMRQMYRKSRGINTCRIARWIVDRLNEGSLTVIQLRTAFNLSATQWNAINTRMQNLANGLTVIETASGE